MAGVTAGNINTAENIICGELTKFFLVNVVTLEAEALKELKETAIKDTYKKAYKKRFTSLRLGGDPMDSEFFTAVKNSREIAAKNVVSDINTRAARL